MKIAVFCGASLPEDKTIVEAASRLGASIGRRGDTLIYGGSNLGLMGALSGAALREGGHVVAIIPTLFGEAVIQSQPVSEIHRVRSMAERKERIIALADAFVALPGGIGTLDEVLEVMVANQLRQIEKPVYLLNLDGFYDAFLAQLDLMHRQMLFRTTAGLQAVASVDELLARLGQAS